VQQVGHHRRFNPYIVQLKKILDANLLGRVLGISGVWSALKNDSYFDVEWRKASGSGGPIASALEASFQFMVYGLTWKTSQSST
jgi:predicted dehydrogenase